MRGIIFCKVGTKCLALGECGLVGGVEEVHMNKIIISTWKGSEKSIEDGSFLNSCHKIEKLGFIFYKTKSISLK